ncbi:uncharacterized protein LAESUDRAFT_715247 [Laetiporus sulphureus 93-53]|uniref:DUF1680-domain-containing protein n=1 Tax=Laetiporus sulphureus 93-53 TaxID=1314785 RepID=A0A165DIB3_9APHY|nr:uncharacterized protein LAESUDRAFT_715247 [Laetiporus sulphureus 93-53]KZT04944.1 hypothetical protein LAESUDRAFT_715247 [Laetiporus sulphureus 93-53]
MRVSFARLGVVCVLLSGLTGAFADAPDNTTLLNPAYQRLKTGTVKPSGWAYNQAQVQAHGLASQQPVWYSYVKDSVWFGGMLEYSEMEEAAPYWFNGWVALAHQLQNDTLLGYVRSFLDYVYASQEESGNFGPPPFNTSLPVLLWPRYMVMLGLIQYAEADPSEFTNITNLLHNFVPYAAERFASGDLGTADQGDQYAYQQVRWEEVPYRLLVLVLQWLYDNDPRDKQAELISLMKAARAQGFSWKDDFYVDNGTFPRVAVTAENEGMHNHGVNVGESIKSEALAWRMTGEQSDIDSTYARVDMIWKYHGRPQGIYTTDEHLAGLEPSRGSEYCASVETLFSLEMIYATLGNPDWADLAERIAYNSVPAQSTPDWWSHQYLQQTNQIWVKNHTDGAPWTTLPPDTTYSNVMGMEPNYPCCTVNHPQGWPKFWSNSFLLADNETALLHALLGPATLSTNLASGVSTNVTVDTLYPFGSTVTYSITASAPYTLYIRIPNWAQSASNISVNGAQATVLSPDEDSALQAVNILEGKTIVELYLDMQIEIEERTNGSIAVYRGPLLYAVDLAYNDTLMPALRSESPLDFIETLPDVPASDLTPYDNHSHDHTWLATVPWNIAIDPSTLAFHEESVDELPYHVWETGEQPQSMTAAACEIVWPLLWGDASWPPQSPNACLGDTFEVTLRPFGGTRLRIGQIPTMTVGS